MGAATSAAGGNNALAGALSAGGAEAAAPIISHYLYGEKDGSKLTAEQKETITAITSLLGTATGAAVGNTTADAVQGSLNAGSAVKNNDNFRLDGLTPDERHQADLKRAYGTDVYKIAERIKNGELQLTKELADYLYTINKDSELVIEDPGNGNVLPVVLIGSKEGWRPNRAFKDEEIHDAHIGYTALSKWAVFGKVVVSRNKDNGKIRLIPDKYDFEMQNGIRAIPRNIETLLGTPGEGTPYRVIYKGDIKIVK